MSCFVIAVAGLAVGCGRADLSDQISGDAYDRETEIFEQVRVFDFGTVGRAYERMAGATYTLRTTTSETDTDGTIVASETRVIRVQNGLGRVEETARVGKLSSGFMTFAVSADSIPDQSPTLMELWVPGQPAFVSARNREFYRYFSRRDTTYRGEPCRVFFVEAVSSVSPDRMPVRRARLVVAGRDSTILALTIVRQDDALFYSEQSVLDLELERESSGAVQPTLRRVSATVEAPFRRPHRFEVVQEYDFGA